MDSLEQILAPFWKYTQIGVLKGESIGGFLASQKGYEIHKFTLKVAPNPSIKLGIFSTIHRDEPEGALALPHIIETLIQSKKDISDYEIAIYPICNPTGLEKNSRYSFREKDLNRHFWKDSQEPEVCLLESEIERESFHGIIALHSDDTSDGLYGFVRGEVISQELLQPALIKASLDSGLPINTNNNIDGFKAKNGIIEKGYEGILSSLMSTPNPFEIVFETPSKSPLNLQIIAYKSAIISILENYKNLISLANDI